MKQISNAFIIGGLFGVVGQLFIFGWTALLGQGNQLVNPLTMVTMGVLGLILFLTGIAPKLEERTTMGVTIPISGMVIAIGGVTFGVKMARMFFSVIASPIWWCTLCTSSSNV